MTVTATPIHPNPAKAPAVTQSTPSPKWAGPVEQARERPLCAHLSEKNLPGLSVAVGVRGDLVWAEGFGFADLDRRLPVAPNHKFLHSGTASPVLHLGRGRPAARGRPPETRRRHSEARAGLPSATVARDAPPVDGPSGRRPQRRRVTQGPPYGKHCEQPLDAVPAVAQNPLHFEPGTRFQYSSYGWILVSAAVEAAAQGPHTLDFLQEPRVRAARDARHPRWSPRRTPSPTASRPISPGSWRNPAPMVPTPCAPVHLSCHAGSLLFPPHLPPTSCASPWRSSAASS